MNKEVKSKLNKLCEQATKDKELWWDKAIAVYDLIQVVEKRGFWYYFDCASLEGIHMTEAYKINKEAVHFLNKKLDQINLEPHLLKGRQR